jgi:hypothetical protein
VICALLLISGTLAISKIKFVASVGFKVIYLFWINFLFLFDGQSRKAYEDLACDPVAYFTD